jgi:hypothetical protein
MKILVSNPCRDWDKVHSADVFEVVLPIEMTNLVIDLLVRGLLKQLLSNKDEQRKEEELTRGMEC